MKYRQDLNFVVLKPIRNQEWSARYDYLPGSGNASVTSCVRIFFQHLDS